jgi:hypothetical protein
MPTNIQEMPFHPAKTGKLPQTWDLTKPGVLLKNIVPTEPVTFWFFPD